MVRLAFSRRHGVGLFEIRDVSQAKPGARGGSHDAYSESREAQELHSEIAASASATLPLACPLLPAAAASQAPESSPMALYRQRDIPMSASKEPWQADPF